MQAKCLWCGHSQDVTHFDDECRRCGECEFGSLLSVTEVATLAGFDRSYINAEIKRGNLRARKIGKSHVIRVEDYDKWMANPRRGSHSSK